MRRLATAMLAAAAVLAAAGAEAAQTVRVPRFERVVLVIFEDKAFDEMVGSPTAPTFNDMARKYALLRNYYAVEIPSLPNYLALISGSTQEVTATCTECAFDARTLAETIEESGRTWKLYAEGLPFPGYTGTTRNRYHKRHNPFAYFESILGSEERLQRMVPYTQFPSDLSRRQLPDFSFVVPDLCNGMHDCSIATGDAWLKRFLTPLLSNRQLRRGVVFVTFDRSDNDDERGGGGHIATLALGPLVKPGAESVRGLSHYGLLRTIEEAWGLPLLGKSARANAITDIWR